MEHLADIVGTFALMGIALSRNVDEWIEFARVGPSAPLIEEVRFATDSAVEEAGFELVWGFPMSRGFFPRLAFDR